jgi:hypothetical protein
MEKVLEQSNSFEQVFIMIPFVLHREHYAGIRKDLGHQCQA